jgi:hypothetical protein
VCWENLKDGWLRERRENASDKVKEDYKQNQVVAFEGFWLQVDREEVRGFAKLCL